MLKHQARKLDQAQFARAAAWTRVTALTSELARLQESREQCSLSPRPHVLRSAGSLQQATLRSDWFQKQELRTEAQLREASGALQERERHLRLARRELKKFELLKERRHGDWQKHELMRAQKELDEVGSRGGAICR